MDNKKVMISIIMPVYNNQEKIRKSIESVVQQTYSDFELIIVNDGSYDASRKVIESYLYDKRIKLYNQNNKGVSNARNKGIDLAVGEYISFLDSDDVYLPNFLEKSIESISNGNVCYSGHFNCDFVTNTTRKAKFKFYEGNILKQYLLNKTTPNTNSWLIKRKYLVDLNLKFIEDISWGEDMIFFSKILLNDKEVKTTGDYLTVYNIDSENSLSYNSLDKISADIYWQNVLIKLISESNADQSTKEDSILAIVNYRRPASIIYRLLSNVNKYSKEKISSTYFENEHYIIKVPLLYNGLRGVKLFLLKLKIKLLLEKTVY